MSLEFSPEILISKPLDVIKNITLSKASDEIQRGGDYQIPKLFAETLKLDSPPQESYRGHIPSLNNGVTSVSHGSLVRFRCMVQNTFNPEYYLNFFTEVNQTTGERKIMLGKYQDNPLLSANCDMDDTFDFPSERVVLECVEIPGESQWVKDAFTYRDSLSRPLTLSQLQAMDSHGVSSTKSKRKVTDTDLHDSTRTSTSTRTRDDTILPPSPLAKVDALASSGSTTLSNPSTSDDAVETMVTLSSPSLSCIVKIYDDMSPNIKIGQVMEVVGILNITTLEQEEGEEQDMFMEQMPPGSSNKYVYRLHAVHVTPLTRFLLAADASPATTAISTNTTTNTAANTTTTATTTGNGNITDTNTNINTSIEVSSPSLPPSIASLLSSSPSREMLLRTRTAILEALTDILCGDKIAAFGVFLHCFVQISNRMSGTPLNHLTIGISNLIEGEIPGAIASNVGIFLQSILPKVRLIPVDISSLNTQKWAPEQNLDSDFLQPGILQVSEGTSLVLDETSMTEGKLESIAIHNIQTFLHLQENSQLQYVIPFSQPLEFPVDTPALILSSKKSILPSDLSIVLHPAVPATSLPSWLKEREGREEGEQYGSENGNGMSISENEPEDSNRELWWLNDKLAGTYIDQARQYIYTARNLHTCFSLSDASVELIQKKIVSRLSQNRQRSTPEVLHIFMNIARLIAISYLKTDVDEQVWEETSQFVDIVLERRERAEEKPAATN